MQPRRGQPRRRAAARRQYDAGHLSGDDEVRLLLFSWLLAVTHTVLMMMCHCDNRWFLAVLTFRWDCLFGCLDGGNRWPLRCCRSDILLACCHRTVLMMRCNCYRCLLAVMMTRCDCLFPPFKRMLEWRKQMLFALFMFAWLHVCLQAQSRTAALDSDPFIICRTHAGPVAHSNAVPFFVAFIVVLGMKPKPNSTPHVFYA